VLNVLVAGVAIYWFPHRELRVVAPAALWIPPRVEHELLDASPDLSMWVYSFRPPNGQEPSSGSHGEPSSPLCAAYAELAHGPRLTGIRSPLLAQICERSRAGLLRPGLTRFNDILAEVLAVAWSARSSELRKRQAACHPAARRAARLLRDTATLGSMSEIARATSLSRERLSRVFAHQFGIGLVQYRNHHRVQQFIREYGYGSDSSMLRAALDVGFGSYVQFHRAFKQVVGHPPAQHLELVREGVVDPGRTGGSSG
jgi:AraC-like DNA-binding protein